MQYLEIIEKYLPDILESVKEQITNDETIFEFVREKELSDVLNIQEKLIKEYLLDFQKNVMDEKKCMQFYKDLQIPYVIIVRSLNFIRKEIIELLNKEGVEKEVILSFSSYFDNFINLSAKVYLKKDIVELKKVQYSKFKQYLMLGAHLEWVEKIVYSVTHDDLDAFPLISSDECKFEEYLYYPESLMVCVDVNLCMYLHDLHSLIHKLANTFYYYYSRGEYSETYMIFKDLKEQILKFKNIIGELYFVTFSNLEISFFKLIEIYQTEKKEFVTLIDMQNLKSYNSIYGEEQITKALHVLEERIHEYFKNDQQRSLVIKGMTANFYMLNVEYEDYEYQKIVNELIEVLKKPVVFENTQIEFKPIICGVEIEDYFNLKKDEIIMILNFLKQKAKKEKLDRFLVVNHKSKELLQNWLKNRYDSKFVKEKIENEEIELVYHPIYDINTHHIYSLEVLVRIVDKDKLIPAGIFIDEVYNMNLIEKLDMAVLNRLLEQREDIKKVTGRVFVNVSFNSLLSEAFLKKLEEVIAKMDIDILLELTEQKFIDNIDVLEELNQKYNLFFAVDDFGTGYTSLQSVVDLVRKGILKVLKIDGSLVKNIDNEYNKKIINVISKMAKELNLLSVAEFVENEEILNSVKDSGIDLAQGFYLAKPHTIKELVVKKTNIWDY